MPKTERYILGEKYCSYIDLLGFSNFVLGMSDDARKVARISMVTDLFGRFEKERISKQVKHLKLEITYFSDSIFISGPTEGEDALGGFLWFLKRIATSCIIRCFLVRGAVVRDLVYHRGNVLFGPAAVKAVELEKRARYPRIILSRAVRKDLRNLNDAQDHVINSSDGPLFINTFFVFQDLARRSRGGNWSTLLKDPDYRRRFERLQALCTFLSENLEEMRDFPEIYEKYYWYASYFDKFVLEEGNSSLEEWPPPLTK
jgi:hypothetical protein